MTYDFSKMPNSLEEFWMPFTPQRLFKKHPRMVVGAEGMYYIDAQGRKIMDGSAGLWCSNLGHSSPYVKEAMIKQMETLDYALAFQMGHPAGFQAATALVNAFPEAYSHVFFTNSGSEAVDTALKMILAHNKKIGKGDKKLFIGRQKSYHGVGFGGISVGGVPYVRNTFTQLLPYVDHMPHTLDLERNAFSKGLPEHGKELADKLIELVELHGPDNVAAVIVEPVVGAPGVIPPPVGYLKRLREICTEHNIFLIFDEVVTGFGRLGEMTAATYFDVEPDIITMAKGLTNGAVPMGATLVRREIYDQFMDGPENQIEFMHGYTYSGHPLACAAVLGTLEGFKQENTLENARKMSKVFEDKLHTLKDCPFVVDIRNCGLLGAVQLEMGDEADPYFVGRSASYEMFNRGVFIRYNGVNLITSPPLCLSEDDIDTLVGAMHDVLHDIKAGKVKH